MCRKYTVEEFERFANNYHKKQFGTTAVMPPRMVEVSDLQVAAAAEGS